MGRWYFFQVVGSRVEEGAELFVVRMGAKAYGGEDRLELFSWRSIFVLQMALGPLNTECQFDGFFARFSQSQVVDDSVMVRGLPSIRGCSQLPLGGVFSIATGAI